MDEMRSKRYQVPEIVPLGEAVRLTEGHNKYVADVAGSGLYYDAKGGPKKKTSGTKKAAAGRKGTAKSSARKRAATPRRKK
jgi:hypothetical protein